MDTDMVVHVYSGILLSYEKCIWVRPDEVDESRGYCTEWSKSEREKQICILMHVYGIYKDGTDESISRAAMEMQA